MMVINKVTSTMNLMVVIWNVGLPFWVINFLTVFIIVYLTSKLGSVKSHKTHTENGFNSMLEITKRAPLYTFLSILLNKWEFILLLPLDGFKTMLNDPWLKDWIMLGQSGENYTHQWCLVIVEICDWLKLLLYQYQFDLWLFWDIRVIVDRA